MTPSPDIQPQAHPQFSDTDRGADATRPSRGQSRWMLLCVCVCALVVIPVIWDARNTIWADSISYLDMATDALRKSPAYLVSNPYWSSGYPTLLAAMMAVARPSRISEFPAAHVLDWLIFLLAAACFSLLLSNAVKWLKANTWPELARDPRQERAFLVCAYALFGLANMNATIWYVAPDLLLQGALYLGAALAIRLFLPGATSKHWALLGVALAGAYYVKAAAFPAGLLLMGLLFLRPPKVEKARRNAVVAMIAFAVVSAPLIGLLTKKVGHFTFGETGKLNYAWSVCEVAHFSDWTGQGGSGTPIHPPRRLMEHPLLLLEFRNPVSGTIPLWYEPSYWYAGLRVPFSVPLQIKALLRVFGEQHTAQTLLFGLVAAAVLLSVLHPKVRRAIGEGGMPSTVLLIWPMAGFLMYAIVNVQFRYVITYVVLGWLGVVAVALPAIGTTRRRQALLAFTAVLALVAGARLATIARRAMHPETALERARNSAKDDVETNRILAAALSKMGIGAGDQLSQIGHSIDNVYFARLLDARMVAQVWEDPLQARQFSAADVGKILTQLRALGVKALIDRTGPGFTNDTGWTPIPGTDTYVRLL